ncbi:MAG: hypothetical protein C0508_10150, partial [Cyanobacteria bacterium PR.023]|nr:hypothetical protein [Cyanobacteria bacterium PR.023]
KIWYQQFLAYEETIDYETGIKELETRISAYKHELVKRNAQTFLMNLKTTARLLRVPVESWVILGFELFKKQIELTNSPKVAIGSIVISLFSKKTAGEEHTEKSAAKHNAKLWEELYQSWESKDNDKISKNIISLIICGLDQHPEIMDWLEHLIQLSLCSGWTAYEVLSEDLWEELVNESVEAAKNVCRGDSFQNQSKKLDLNLLFNYDFNLANQMGTVLKERYHFSSEKGIKTAFEDCLTYKPGQKKQIVRNDALYEIEQKRHLIQHSGGIVDEGYRENTKSALIVGEKLSITAKDLDDALTEITNAGFALLDRTDNWLENQKKIRASKEKP